MRYRHCEAQASEATPFFDGYGDEAIQPRAKRAKETLSAAVTQRHIARLPARNWIASLRSQ